MGQDLAVNADGTVVANGPYGGLVEQTDQEVIVHPVVNDQPGPQGAEFIMSTLKGALPAAGSSGMTVTLAFTFVETLDRVNITNSSPKTLRIQGVQPLSSGGSAPTIRFSRDGASVGAAPDSVQITIAHAFAPTLVTITNLGDSDIILDGPIDNPIGTVVIRNVGGSILATAQAALRSNILNLQAAQGGIGAGSNPLGADLVESRAPQGPDRPIQVAALAGSDVYLSLRSPPAQDRCRSHDNPVHRPHRIRSRRGRHRSSRSWTASGMLRKPA